MAATPELLARAAGQGWYHTLELAPGHVTPGMFDMRPYADAYGLPARMDGLRALDVGTWDGFWAFELERRGAEVVALDLDDVAELDSPPRRRPPMMPAHRRGAGFELAREALDSRVRRVVRNVYDARPEELGTFDWVFCGFVLVHLRDQLLALERIAALCRGTFVLGEEHDRLCDLLPFAASRYRADRPQAVVYWVPSARTWKRMLWTAGFDRVDEHARLKVRARDGFTVPQVVLHASASSTVGRGAG